MNTYYQYLLATGDLRDTQDAVPSPINSLLKPLIVDDPIIGDADLVRGGGDSLEDDSPPSLIDATDVPTVNLSTINIITGRPYRDPLTIDPETGAIVSSGGGGGGGGSPSSGSSKSKGISIPKKTIIPLVVMVIGVAMFILKPLK